MIKKIISTILLLLMLGCAGRTGVKMYPEYDQIDHATKPYLVEFIYHSKGKITQDHYNFLTVGFKHLAPGVAGSCFISPFFKEIDIDIGWWEENPHQLAREGLIYHELGHCILYRAHTEPIKTSNPYGVLEWILFELGIWKMPNRFDDGCPMSYMHPETFNLKCIETHREYYIKELFSKSNNELIDDFDHDQTHTLLEHSK